MMKHATVHAILGACAFSGLLLQACGQNNGAPDVAEGGKQAGGSAGSTGHSDPAGDGGTSGFRMANGGAGASGPAGSAGQGGNAGLVGSAGQGGNAGLVGLAGQGGNAGIVGSAGTTATGSGTRVLFIRGADASGGFLEANNDAERTEHLADINNASTSNGNHGWAQWAAALRGDNFQLEQIKEGNLGQTPVDFANMDISPYSVIVLGSNNAVYGSAAVTKVQDWVKMGGGLLTISDGNFGSNWGAAPSSDTSFLQGFGVIVNQDNGQYGLRRDGGDFLVPNHPILNGVNVFDGEGVSPCTVTGPVSGVSTQIVARAQGQKHLNDNPNGGSLVNVGAQDGSLIVGSVQNGRFACSFDRNTFFNSNGAGTDLTHNDNLAYGRNLIAWLAKRL